MISSSYLNEINIEREARLKGRMIPDPNAIVLWNRAINDLNSIEEKDILIKAFNFAKGIKYQHEGLASDIYFAHPIRVAALSLLSQKSINVDTGIIGLLHNVFELSNTTVDSISLLFGESIALQILDLTVNRDLQWNQKYKESYYTKINSNSLACRIVKIFDKLDNLFLLDLNPNEEIKQKYMIEIETYILPMTERDMPEVYNYMQNIIQNYHFNDLKKKNES
jgi:(p)ppGpp synthase/HD superfamily hydrolase